VTGDKKIFAVRLEGDANNETAHVHTLRFILKHLLRARSLKCTDVREVNTDTDTENKS
jgi:hypothetical protein